jgi:arylsulfatase A-like enzyme
LACFGRALAALAAGVAVTLLFDLVFAALRGDPGPPGYPLLVAGLTLAPVLVVAALLGWSSRSVELCLAGWVVVEVAAAYGASAVLGGSLALGLGASTAAALGFASPRPGSAGVLVGATLFAAVVLGPRAAPVLVLPEWATFALAFEAALVALALGARFARILLHPGIVLVAGVAALVVVSFVDPKVDKRGFGDPPSASSGPNILVLILDTVRQDHLSLYGYARENTPELARLVAESGRAAVFRSAYSPSNWTIPSHISFFTGTLPSEHQAHCANRVHLRPTELDISETLAERLAGAGYRTAAVIANPTLMAVRGTERGFGSWLLEPAPRQLSFVGERLRRRFLPLAYRKQELSMATARSINARVLDLLDSCRDGGCFVVANYIDAHIPYLPSAPYAGSFDQRDPLTASRQLSAADGGERVMRAAAAYDEEILELDAHLGRLFRELAERGLLEDMWLVVTSDHGEAFQEHRSVHHASSLYDEQVKIPLIVFYPKRSFLPAHEQAVGLLDVTATLAAVGSGAVLGHGRDLRALRLEERGVRMEFFGCPYPKNSWGPYSDAPARAVVRGQRKLLELQGRRELYLLSEDPEERVDRFSFWPEIAAELESELPPLEARSDRVSASDAPMAREAREALRALGYIE